MQEARRGGAIFEEIVYDESGQPLALDYALRPVLQSMGARHIVQSHFVPEQHMRFSNDRLELDAASMAPLQEAVYHLKASLGLVPYDALLGHPRPERQIAWSSGRALEPDAAGPVRR